MSRSIALVLFIVMLPRPSFGQRTTYCSYAFGKKYESTITREAVNKAPAWDEKDENPPLSARKAIRLANDRKSKLVKDSETWKWELKAASVEPFSEGRWYWHVHYQARFLKGGMSGIPHHLDLFVLMDGTVIEPTVEDYRRIEEEE